jgi:hypothetical protein
MTQEPIAYINVERRRLEFAHPYVKWDTPLTVKLERIPLYTHPLENVQWGVDWGRAGDIPCVSIIKRLPNGGVEVVAVEYAPYTFKEKNHG